MATALDPYAEEQSAIQRRQKVAEMLMQQGAQPMETNQVAGGYVVPVSPLSGVAKIAQQLAGAYVGKQADDRATELNNKRLTDLSSIDLTSPDAANKFMSLGQPETAVTLANAVATRNDKIQERQDKVKEHQDDLAWKATESEKNDKRDFENRKEMAKIMAANRPAPQPRQDPLVQVMGENGQPVYMPSSQAVGKQPFNAQLAKTDSAKDAATQGKEAVSSVVANLNDLYDQLDKSGGITNPDKTGLENVSAGAGSSTAGQIIGKLFGTKNQSTRNEIAQQRPLLLQQIMKATGMSAKQMDSNAELKLWLSTATDPTLDVKANKAALANIDAMYGTNLNPEYTKPNKATPHSSGASGEWIEQNKASSPDDLVKYYLRK